MQRIIKEQVKEVTLENVTSIFIGVDQSSKINPNRKGFVAKCPGYKWSLIFVGNDYDMKHESVIFADTLESLMQSGARLYSFDTRKELLEWLIY